MADLQQLAEARGDVVANIIFVHGLTGDSLETWTTPNRELWSLWLSQNIDGIAVYTVGYDAPVSSAGGGSMHPTQIAKNLFNHLLIDGRPKQGQIIFIGHSLGGLIIKMMIRRAHAEKAKGEIDNFLKRVKKVAFLATPHSGADLAGWGDLMRVLVHPSPAATSLVRNDANLIELKEAYYAIAQELSIDHLILTETQHLIWPVKKYGFSTQLDLGLIVKEDQADPGGLGTAIPVPADHVSIAKPNNRSGEVYKFVKAFVTRSDTIASPGPDPAPPPSHKAPENSVLAIWQERLEALQLAEATAVSAPERFSIRKGIEEAKAKIREYGGQA